MGSLVVGASVVFPGTLFNPDETLSAFKEEKVTHTTIVPTMLFAIVSAQEKALAAGDKTSLALENVTLAGTNITPEAIRHCFEELGSKGARNGYGMTEGYIACSGFAASFDQVRTLDGTLSCGTVVNGSTVKACLPDERTPVAVGIPGELHYSSPSLVDGYIGLDSPAFYTDEEGKRWFATGDQGVFDEEGRIYVTGRYKDMIIRAGENIAPAAIEAVVGKVKELAELMIQVVGVSDEVAGEVPVAVGKSSLIVL